MKTWHDISAHHSSHVSPYWSGHLPSSILCSRKHAMHVLGKNHSAEEEQQAGMLKAWLAKRHGWERGGAKTSMSVSTKSTHALLTIIPFVAPPRAFYIMLFEPFCPHCTFAENSSYQHPASSFQHPMSSAKKKIYKGMSWEGGGRKEGGGGRKKT